MLNAVIVIEKVFLGAAGLDLLALVFFAIVASGEIQAWAVHHHTHQDTNVKMSALSEKDA